MAANVQSAPDAPRRALPASPACPWWQRVAFRFAIIYLGLYCFASALNLSAIPFGDFVQQALTWPFAHVTVWAGTHIFHLSGVAATRHQTGSGDTALDWVQVTLLLTLAALGSAIWAFLSRQRAAHPAVVTWFLLLVRYTLALAMIEYGLIKISPQQFGPLTYRQLGEPFGSASPMGMLWTFMNASSAYTLFCGTVEFSAGLLLLFERTRVLGSLLALTAMGNVLALNLCYDVDVKLYSFHLLLMALVLAAPDLHSLTNYLLRGRVAIPTVVRVPRDERRWIRMTGRTLLTAFLGLTLYANLSSALQAVRHPWMLQNRPSFAGLWNVTSFERSGVQAPANDPHRWRQLAIDFPGWWVMEPSDPATPGHGYQVTSANGDHYALHDVESGSTASLVLRSAGQGQMVLTGTLDGAPATLRLSRVDDRSFRLQNRGFHWISEYPFNY